MTTYEALQSAVARWGSRAMIERVHTIGADGHDYVVCCVGAQHDEHSWSVRGQGGTWQAAFTDADRSEVRTAIRKKAAR